MNNWLRQPKSIKVAKYVECYWLIEKHPQTNSYQYPKLTPDPAAHLVISPTDQIYHYDMNPGLAKGKGSYLLFPHHQTFELDHSKPFVHLGIKFRVGALYSLDIVNDSHLTLDAVEYINITKLLNIDEFNAIKLIDIARNDPDLCCKQLDALLLPWLEKGKEDQHSELTRKVLQFLDNTPISELSNELYCSQRTLERSFSRVTGLTLKQCQAMRKLEAMLEYLYQRDISDIDWVEVALQFGFSDQPHLIRHLKKQIGLTPNNYAKERGLTIDVYGGIQYF